VNHHKNFVNSMWDIGEAVQKKLCMKITYTKQDGTTVERVVKPVGLMFSEFYFYLTAYIERIDKENEFQNKNDTFPTIYRIDRIQNFEVLDRHFDIPYRDRFEEGEFRKRVQFMYSGPLKTIKFEFSGPSLEAILDRIPTAEIVAQEGNKTTIKAECYGDGVLMWLRTQGDNVKIL